MFRTVLEIRTRYWPYCGNGTEGFKPGIWMRWDFEENDGWHYPYDQGYEDRTNSERSVVVPEPLQAGCGWVEWVKANDDIPFELLGSSRSFCTFDTKNYLEFLEVM